MSDSSLRSILKTFTYRAVGVLTTATVAFLVTGRLAVAVPVGLVDSLTKIVVYYGHERAWQHTDFGRKSRTESAA
jgi:uncharacterized membrane protein